jgi:hypothetical protein
MSRAPLLFVLLASSSLLHASCSSDSSNAPSNLLVADTLGNVYTVSCSSYCALTPKDSGLQALSCGSGDGVDTFVLTGSQILTVHALLISSYGTTSFSAAEPARPLACSSDADCVPGLSPTYTCQNGLCQSVSTTTPLTTTDVVALCQADIPWPKECPYLTNPQFVSRLAEVAAACALKSNNCSTVPADCRQPVPVTPGLDAGAASEPVLDAGIDAGT